MFDGEAFVLKFLSGLFYCYCRGLFIRMAKKSLGWMSRDIYLFMRMNRVLSKDVNAISSVDLSGSFSVV